MYNFCYILLKPASCIHVSGRNRSTRVTLILKYKNLIELIENNQKKQKQYLPLIWKYLQNHRLRF